MKKINSGSFSFYRNNEHGQFHSVVREELIKETPEKLGIIPFYQSYVDAVTSELSAIEVEQGSQHSRTIEDADILRDRLYRSFVLHINSCLLSFDSTVQDAADRILRIVNQVGDMRKQPYNQESKTLTSLTSQLESNYSADITSCNADVQLSKLKEANDSFVADFGTRASEVSARISGDVRAARVVVDAIYKNIITVINALVLLNGEAEYSTFIDKVNYQIDYYKNTINNRRSKGKDKAESTPTI